MGPIWGRRDPDGPHVGPMNFAIWDGFRWIIQKPLIRSITRIYTTDHWFIVLISFHATNPPAPFPKRLYHEIQDDFIYNKGRHRVSTLPVYNGTDASISDRKFPELKKTPLKPMWNSTRKILQQFYAPHNRFLKELIGPQFRVWHYG